MQQVQPVARRRFGHVAVGAVEDLYDIVVAGRRLRTESRREVSRWFCRSRRSRWLARPKWNRAGICASVGLARIGCRRRRLGPRQMIAPRGHARLSPHGAEWVIAFVG